MKEKTPLNTTYEITWMSIFRLIIVAVALFLLFCLSDLILLLFIVLVLSISLSPLVDKIRNRFKIPRILTIIIIFSAVLTLLFFTIYTIIPPAIEQTRNLYQSLPEHIKKIIPFLQSVNNYSSPELSDNIGNSFIQIADGFFGSIFNFIFIFVLTFLLLIEENGISKYIVSLIPIKEKEYAIEIGKKISNKIGAWFLGQLSLMAIIGLCNFLVFWIVGIPYALTLGVLAFLFESIPNVGPFLAATLAIILAYIDAPWKAVVVLISAILIEQLEGQFLAPKIMGKILNISAFVIILGLIIGGELAGITGMILALPIIAAAQVIAQEWPNIKQKEGYRWQKK